MGKVIFTISIDFFAPKGHTLREITAHVSPYFFKIKSTYFIFVDRGITTINTQFSRFYMGKRRNLRDLRRNMRLLSRPIND